MTASSLPAALRAAAEGLYAIEAATGLIIVHGTWLGRRTSVGSSSTGPGRRPSTEKPPSAPWTLASSLARREADAATRRQPRLGDAITGIDEHNVGLLIKSVRHASGRRQF